jgi:hypothetical protein
MNWELYVSRRKIDAAAWVKSRNISTKESFLQVISDLHIDPPDELYLSALFPQITPESSDESSSSSPEGVDQVATRSVADEGDGADLRSNVERTSKVRV